LGSAGRRKKHGRTSVRVAKYRKLILIRLLKHSIMLVRLSNFSLHLSVHVFLCYRSVRRRAASVPIMTVGYRDSFDREDPISSSVLTQVQKCRRLYIL
jgi:hypothetical protein